MSVRVTSEQVAGLEGEALRAEGRLADLDRGVPSWADPAWVAAYQRAKLAADGARARADAGARALAVQVEADRTRGERAANASGDLGKARTALQASADQLGSAVAQLQEALALVASVAGRHNRLVTSTRMALAELDLMSGGEHADGAEHGPGVFLSGELWRPVSPEQMVARELGALGRHVGGPHHGFAVPGLAGRFGGLEGLKRDPATRDLPGSVLPDDLRWQPQTAVSAQMDPVVDRESPVVYDARAGRYRRMTAAELADPDAPIRRQIQAEADRAEREARARGERLAGNPDYQEAQAERLREARARDAAEAARRAETDAAEAARRKRELQQAGRLP